VAASLPVGTSRAKWTSVDFAKLTSGY